MVVKKKTVIAAPTGAAVAVNQKEVIEVRNVSGHTINTTKGAIKVDECGKCTVAELRQLHKYLEPA